MAGAIKIICPNLGCRTVLSVPAVSRGKNVRCKVCGGYVTVPKKRKAPVVTDPEATDGADSTAA